MPEKITIVKESGESVTSNVMSVFMIPETNKQYIITTENAVDPHGLTVLHVSEISENNLLKVQTDDEWSSIKTIMRAIISSNVGSYKYIPTITNANAKDLYSRDISVSAGAAKQLLDSYTNGPKEVAIKDDTIPERDPNAIESDSIFPTANVETDENAEIAPGLSTVDETAVVEEQATSTPDTLENAITDDQVVDVPIIDNNQIVETPIEPESAPVEESPSEELTVPESIEGETPTSEPVAEEPAVDIPIAEAADVQPAEEPVPVPEPVEEIPAADGTLEAPVPESAPVDGGEPVADAGVIPVAIPVLDAGAEGETVAEDNLVPVAEDGEVVKEEISEETPVAEPVEATIEEAVPPIADGVVPADDVVPVEGEETPTDELVPTEEVPAVPEEEQPVEEASIIPEAPIGEQPVEEPESAPVVNNVVNANIDENTIKDALNEIVGDRIESTLNEKVSELLPSTIQESMAPAIENTLPEILGDKIKEPISESVETTLETLIQDKIQAPLMETVTNTVNETIEKQAKALNSVGIKLDFGVESSFGKKASLDEIVAASQELFVEGVKNLIMVMTERVYKELRIKEDELKRREVIVAQREQAVNDKTLAMMNGTYNPTDYQAYTPAAPVAPEMGVPPVAPVMPVAPVAQPVPVAPVATPVPGVVPEVAPAVEPVPSVVPTTPVPAVEVAPEAPVPEAPVASVEPVPVQTAPAPVEAAVPPVADVAPVPAPPVEAAPEAPAPVPEAPVAPVEPVPVQTAPVAQPVPDAPVVPTT